MTSSASLAATISIDSSAVLRPVRDASRGLTSQSFSYVVSCTTGTSRSRRRRAESSLSAMPSAGSRRSRAGVTSTIPTREFAKPLSMARSKGTPRPTSFSLNQTETPRDSSRSCSCFAAVWRSSQAWQRNTSRSSGSAARVSTLVRIGSSARTSSGVYNKDEPAGDHLGFMLLPPLPPLLRDEEWDRDAYDREEYGEGEGE